MCVCGKAATVAALPAPLLESSRVRSLAHALSCSRSLSLCDTVCPSALSFAFALNLKLKRRCCQTQRRRTRPAAAAAVAATATAPNGGSSSGGGGGLTSTSETTTTMAKRGEASDVRRTNMHTHA